MNTWGRECAVAEEPAGDDEPYTAPNTDDGPRNVHHEDAAESAVLLRQGRSGWGGVKGPGRRRPTLHAYRPAPRVPRAQPLHVASRPFSVPLHARRFTSKLIIEMRMSRMSFVLPITAIVIDEVSFTNWLWTASKRAMAGEW